MGIALPIDHLSKDVFVRLRAAGKAGARAQTGLTLDERSSVLGLLRVGSTMYLPEEFDSLVRPLPDDEEEAGQFEQERELHYLARKVANVPDIVEHGLMLLGQPDLLEDFREVYKEELERRSARLAQSREKIDGFFPQRCAAGRQRTQHG